MYVPEQKRSVIGSYAVYVLHCLTLVFVLQALYLAVTRLMLEYGIDLPMLGFVESSASVPVWQPARTWW